MTHTETQQRFWLLVDWIIDEQRTARPTTTRHSEVALDTIAQLYKAKDRLVEKLVDIDCWVILFQFAEGSPILEWNKTKDLECWIDDNGEFCFDDSEEPMLFNSRREAYEYLNSAPLDDAVLGEYEIVVIEW